MSNYVMKGSIAQLAKMNRLQFVSKMIDNIRKDERLSEMYKKKWEEIYEFNIEKLRDKNKEVQSWETTTYDFIQLLSNSELGKLTIVLEFIASGSIDALIFGENSNHPIALIVELKGWDSICKKTWTIGGDNDYKVVTIPGDENKKRRSHPIWQIKKYNDELMHYSAVQNGEITIKKCAYLPNFEDINKLFKGVYDEENVPLYKRCKGECFTNSDDLVRYIKSSFDISKSFESNDNSFSLLDGSSYLTSDKGVERLMKVKGSMTEFDLKDEQPEILDKIDTVCKNNQKNLFIITGGPGTGKTYVGMDILIHFWNKGYKDGVYLVKSRTIRDTMEVLSTQDEGESIPVYGLDQGLYGKHSVVVIDEAHRTEDCEKLIYKLSDNNEAKNVVVLLDERQRILVTEEGTYDNYKNAGLKFGYNVVPSVKPELEDKSNKPKDKSDNLVLKTQQRAKNFGETFVDDLTRFFSINKNSSPVEPVKTIPSNIILGKSLKEIDALLDESVKQNKVKENNIKAQWIAPFSWPWKSAFKDKKPSDYDIIISEEKFKKKWNPMNEQGYWYLKKTKGSKDRVACVYTTQGLDFDDVGFIFWDGLVWRLNNWEFDINKCYDDKSDIGFIKTLVNKYWPEYCTDNEKGKPTVNVSRSKDGRIIIQKDDNNVFYLDDQIKADSNIYNEILEVVLNRYLILMSRATNRMFIWFKDKDTEEHFLEFFYPEPNGRTLGVVVRITENGTALIENKYDKNITYWANRKSAEGLTVGMSVSFLKNKKDGVLYANDVKPVH